jgi:hypothetical protein
LAWFGLLPPVSHCRVFDSQEDSAVRSSDPTDRTFAAYFRYNRIGTMIDQPANSSREVDYRGRQYVVLHNVRGILAVYRVRTSGALKRLRRWPAALEG